MVLKIFFILFTLVSSFAYAQNIEYLFRLEKYEDVVLETDGSTDFKDLEYKALALERTGNLDGPINIYLSLIKKRFKNENLKIIESIKLKKATIELESEDKETLLYYFSNLANLFTKKYLQMNRGISKKQRRAVYKRSYLFIAILKLLDDFGSEADVLLDKIDKKRDTMLSYDYKSNNYFISGIVSWQDILELSYKDGSDKSKILNTSYANCTGGGKVWKNDHQEFYADICLLLGFSSISRVSGRLQLTDSQVPVTGLLTNIGSLYSFKSPDIAIGPSLSILSIKGNWEHPDNTDLEPKQYTRLGITFTTKWYLKKVAVLSGFGRIFKNESYFFNLSAVYNY